MRSIFTSPDAGSSRKEVRVTLALALLLSFVCTTAVGKSPASTRAAAAHPLLLRTAAQTPDAQVSVIVQKGTANREPEGLVARLGGKVTKDLSIINAFAANLTARAAIEVARADGIRWVSPDAMMVETTCLSPCLDTSQLTSVYPQAIRADQVWNTPSYLQGQGIGVAVIDSGVALQHPDFSNSSGGTRVVVQVEFNSMTNSLSDMYGHGTHVAGIIAGNGTASGRRYIGVAPKANIISVKVSDDYGASTASDVVAGLQWVLENKARYNIQVVNISLNSSVMQSYHVDPLDAAVEVLWFNRIVVVVAAGNTGRNALYPPANDPFVITVGAVDDRGTLSSQDDEVASFSGYGRTGDRVNKPDLVAPGVNIISSLSSTSSTNAVAHSSHLVFGFPGSQYYFRMSGTSMAAPVVSGAAALLLQDEPHLTPDQVKYRLMNTASRVRGHGLGAGIVDVYATINGTGTQSANSGIEASQLLWTGSEPITWGSVNWNSVNWNSVNWNSVNWNSVNWNSVNWNSDHWEP